MSLEHNFYRTNENCYQGKAGQVHQLKVLFFFSLRKWSSIGKVLFKMIDFIISSFIKVCDVPAQVIRTTSTDSAYMSNPGTYSKTSNSTAQSFLSKCTPNAMYLSTSVN